MAGREAVFHERHLHPTLEDVALSCELQMHVKWLLHECRVTQSEQMGRGHPAALRPASGNLGKGCFPGPSAGWLAVALLPGGKEA